MSASCRESVWEGVHGNCMSGSLCAKDRRRHSFPFPHYGGNFLNVSEKFGGILGNLFGIFFENFWIFFWRNFLACLGLSALKTGEGIVFPSHTMVGFFFFFEFVC